MTRTHRFQWSAILPVVALVLASCGGSSTGGTASSVSANTGGAGPSFKPLCTPQSGKSYKVALIIAQGGLGDQSYNDLAYSGFQKAVKEAGIEGKPVESKDVVAQAERVNG